jgi:hypothetical protein
MRPKPGSKGIKWAEIMFLNNFTPKNFFTKKKYLDMKIFLSRKSHILDPLFWRPTNVMLV